MHIKRVTIDNLVSYEKLMLPQQLSPGLNLFVGANGSGKSNFLQAIIFALSDTHSKKTKQERRQYLNNKCDAKEYSVEVVLDNTDQRVALTGNEVIVRKTYNVDTDKDTYTLNGIHMQEGVCCIRIGKRALQYFRGWQLLTLRLILIPDRATRISRKTHRLRGGRLLKNAQRGHWD